MSCCFTIYPILESLDGVPSDFINSDGLVTLDADGSLTHVMQDTGISETTKLKENSTKQITLLSTPKNDYFLGRFKRLTALGEDFSALKVLVIEKGLPIGEDILEVNGYNNGYQCTLKFSEDFWINGAKELKLNEIDLGEFEFTEDNINATNQWLYLDSNDYPITFPHIDFGYFPEGYYHVKRMRFLVSVLALLRAGFCAIGWSFKSPILESNYGRDWWAYLLSEDFGDYDGKGKGCFGANVSSDTLVEYQNDDFLSADVNLGEDYNGCDFYVASSGFSPTGTQHSAYHVILNIVGRTFTADEMNNGANGTWLIRVSHFSGTNVVKSAFRSVSWPNTEVSIDEYFDDFKEGDFISFRIETPNGETASIVKERILIEPSDGILNIGDTLNIGELLREDTLFDFSMGIIEALQGKFITDFGTKTVTLFHDTRMTMPTGESPDTYRRKVVNTIDVDCTSKSLIIKDLKNEKHLYRFKKSTDGWITYNKSDGKEGLFSHMDGEDGKIKNHINSYFEPTEMKQLFGGSMLNKAGDEILDLKLPYLPAMIENYDPKVESTSNSFNIAPRLLKMYPSSFQGSVTDKVLVPYGWDVNDDQLLKEFALAVHAWDGIHNGKATRKNLAYGGDFDNTLYDLFIKHLPSLSQVVKYNANINRHTFNFRDTFNIKDDLGSYMGIITSVDKSGCDGDLSSITVSKYSPDDCNCNLPCDCIMSTCVVNMDYNTITDEDGDGTYGHILSFKVDGVEQLPSPVGVTTPYSEVTFANGLTLQTNLIDTLNSLGIEHFTFSPVNPQTVRWQTGFMAITVPSCIDYEIIHEAAGFNWFITKIGARLMWNGELYNWTYNDQAGTWDPIPQMCIEHRPEDCVSDPSLSLELKHYYWNMPVGVSMLYLNLSGVMMNVGEIFFYIKRPQISPSWVQGSYLSTCETGAYPTFSHAITDDTSAHAIIHFDSFENCDGSAIESISQIDGNGNVIDRTAESAGFDIEFNDTNMANWNDYVKVIIEWNSIAGLSSSEVVVTPSGNAADPNYSDTINIAKDTTQAIYDIEGKVVIEYDNGCPTETIIKTL